MRTALCAILLIATATVAAADQPSRYLCVVEKSADLHYDSRARTWVASASVPGDRFVLRRLSDEDRKSWGKPEPWWGFFKLAEASDREVSRMALCDIDLKCSGAAEFDKPSKDGSLTWRLYRYSPRDPDDVLIETGQCSAL